MPSSFEGAANKLLQKINETPRECATCLYMRDLGNGRECRRYPPVSVTGSPLAIFPRVTGGDYCGEYRMR